MEVEIRRSDLLRLSLYLLPRARSNRVAFAVFVLTGFVAALAGLGDLSGIKIAIAALMGVVAGVLGMSGLLLLYLALASEKSGTLGKRTFTVDAAGLTVETVADRTLHKWPGVSEILRSQTFIAIRLSSNLFHIIPRRAFLSEEDFDRFWTWCSKQHGLAA